ncbi:MAG: family 43 glycosylhydrolase [Solirubrobacterales bacterium]|nr:family 43 glycosylhydrolase [Solirubrobacterales bacterium]
MDGQHIGGGEPLSSRRLVVFVVVVVALAALLPASAAQAGPIRDGRTLLSCPDPTVLDAHVGGYRYYLSCTSDVAPNAFPLRGSNDLVHWHRLGYVFPAGQEPWWAQTSPRGRFWAPALYRIEHRWVIYFAAQYDPRKLRLSYATGGPVSSSTMLIGVATATSLHGPWQSRVLHYRGQFNGIDREKERYGGVIDPSVGRDTATGQLYLFWAEQHSSIWVTALSPDGLTISPAIHQALIARHGWECATPRGTCVIEGPEETFRDGWFYLFFSGGSTWTGTYAIGVGASRNPLVSQFRLLDNGPALRSGGGYIGPGGSSAPVTAPDGEEEIFYHAMIGPNPRHVSGDRYLFSSPIFWQGKRGLDPRIGSGVVS